VNSRFDRALNKFHDDFMGQGYPPIFGVGSYVLNSHQFSSSLPNGKCAIYIRKVRLQLRIVRERNALTLLPQDPYNYGLSLALEE